MNDRTYPGFTNTRRALRMMWNRTINISGPVDLRGHSLNVSATGILLSIGSSEILPVGSIVSLSIPHHDLQVDLTMRGKVVRVEEYPDHRDVAIDFMA